MEVSSHALDQGRVDGVRFHSAAFTNLTPRSPGLSRQHGSVRRSQGATCFEAADLKHIVLNIGDEFGRALARELRRRRVR